MSADKKIARGVWLYSEEIDAISEMMKHFDCSSSEVIRKAIWELYDKVTLPDDKETEQ